MKNKRKWYKYKTFSNQTNFEVVFEPLKLTLVCATAPLGGLGVKYCSHVAHSSLVSNISETHMTVSNWGIKLLLALKWLPGSSVINMSQCRNAFFFLNMEFPLF